MSCSPTSRSTPTMRSPSQTTPGSPPLLMTTRRYRHSSPLLTPRSVRGASCPSTVTLSEAIDSELNVQFDTADGTATRTDNGYTSVTGGILTIAAGNTTGTIEVNTGVDSIVELDESFTLTLSNIEAGGATITFADNQGTGTITNDDTATLAIDDISASEATAPSPSTSRSPVTWSRDLPLITPPQMIPPARAKIITATAGTLSFTGTNGETQSVTVNSTNDAVVEDAEFFNVLLSNLSLDPNYEVTIADDTGIATIADDDSAVTLSIADATVSEGGQLSFTVTLSEAIDSELNVQFDTADGTATRTDNDYTSVTGGILTIAAGNTTGTIEVNTGVDSIVELDESFTLTLSNIEAGGATVTFADNQGTGTITNDDTATLAIDDISASEADGTVTFQRHAHR